MSGTKTRAHGRITGRTAPRVSSRQRRHLRVRKKVEGSAVRPRLVVTRSARNTFAQLIDDTVGNTLASASTLEESIRSAAGDKTAKAKQVGALLAERAGRPASARPCSTAAATPTTAGSPRSPTARAKAGWPSR